MGRGLTIAIDYDDIQEEAGTFYEIECCGETRSAAELAYSILSELASLEEGFTLEDARKGVKEGFKYHFNRDISDNSSITAYEFTKKGELTKFRDSYLYYDDVLLSIDVKKDLHHVLSGELFNYYGEIEIEDFKINIAELDDFWFPKYVDEYGNIELTVDEDEEYSYVLDCISDESEMQHNLYRYNDDHVIVFYD